MYTTKQIKFNARDAAASREQKRVAHLENEERNKEIPVFMFKKFGFRPYYGAMKGDLKMDGPLCPHMLDAKRNCLSGLSGVSIESTEATCDVCESKYTLPIPFQKFRDVAKKAYEGYLNFVQSGNKIVTLDSGYSSVAKDQANKGNKWVKVFWSQKNGRNMAIIYCIDRDDNGDKVQIFADMEREELRYDANDIPPGKVLAKIKAEFKNTEINVNYGEKSE
ncbi:hypothetical protein KA089_00435 [Candidatus Woesebacteria bacterium]|nr:hypothetical protein [Candidatus Woesebacteria bacterium]